MKQKARFLVHLAYLIDNALQALREVDVRLGNCDTNRIVRPLEWGFGWLKDFSPIALEASDAPVAEDDARMITFNADIVARAGWGHQN